MKLAPRASCHLRQKGDIGYAMAALLVAMAVMAVLLTVAMPTWKQANQREKEAELLFRLTQYNRAIAAYGKSHGSPGPPTIDALVTEHFLRKKYKDPLSPEAKDDFQVCYASTQGGAAATTCSTNPTGVIIGVVSKSKSQSIAYFLEDPNNNSYDKWLSQLTPLPPSPQGQVPGGPGQPAGGGRGTGLGGGDRSGSGPGNRGGGIGGGANRGGDGGRRTFPTGNPTGNPGGGPGSGPVQSPPRPVR
jgi:type II secretory pathway pseudopilin PulG